MAVDIQGWVETSWRDDDDILEEDYHWQGVIRLGPVLHGATDDVAAALFGFSKAAITERSAYPAAARERGIPPRCSVELRRDLEDIARHEAKYGPGEFGGYTHITWREIKTLQWDAYGVSEATRAESDWSTLFAMLSLLEKRDRDDKIRIVAWWCW